MLHLEKTAHIRGDGVSYWEIGLRSEDGGHVSPCHDGGPLIVLEENTIIEDMVRRALDAENLLEWRNIQKTVRIIRDVVETLHFGNRD